MTTSYKEIDRTVLSPSKTNDREEFKNMDELAASENAGGIKVPLIVRPKGKAGHFEIVCGERRWRAAGMSGPDWPNLPLAKVPCIVKELTDAEALDYQTDENLNRNDLTPLELAKRFRRYIDQKLDKHAAEKIAAKHGYSASWVWDVMKILDLIALGKKLIQQGRMTLNHAILIARQTKEDQERILEPDSGALFQREEAYGLDIPLPFAADEDRKKGDPYDGLKTRSVRELKAWIAKYIRFDVKQAAKAAPLEFEAVAEAIKEAEAVPGRGRKVIAITHSHHVAPEAKDEEGERTYGPSSWKRADGSDKDAPKCEHSVLGEVVVGPEYGSVFRVCIARDKCEVHFGDVIKAKEKREKDKASGKAPDRNAEQKKYEEQQRKEQEKRQREHERWAAFYPALRKAMEAKLVALPLTLPTTLFQRLIKELELPKSTTQAEFAKAFIIAVVKSSITRLTPTHHWEHGEKQMVEWANVLGVNVKACEPKPEKPAKVPAPAKKKSTKAAAKKKPTPKK